MNCKNRSNKILDRKCKEKKMIYGILSGKVTIIRLILGLVKKMKYR